MPCGLCRSRPPRHQPGASQLKGAQGRLRAIQYAANLGTHLTLGGFSNGGALAMDAAYRNENVEALLLFSPAVKVSDPKAGHAPFEEQPDAFLAALDEFLERSKTTAKRG